MAASDQGTILIRRPQDWVGGSLRSFMVRIDGRRAGTVPPRSVGEFAVPPGEHTVVVTMDWVRSVPRQVSVGPGSRVELAIRARPEKASWWKLTWPIVVVVLIGQGLTDIALKALDWPDPGFLARTGVFLLFYFSLFGLFILLTSAYWPDHWALWTLEEIAGQSP
jgi:hypothetical protein